MSYLEIYLASTMVALIIECRVNATLNLTVLLGYLVTGPIGLALAVYYLVTKFITKIDLDFKGIQNENN